ncbi:porin family protein [Vibrio sp. ZSDE26]|uniref:Porin family protein n=1 Tax=Vibrio amylolyticus TaxID=2847292 RepID=A0A9X1XMT9_9VIBR|nr:outer membrane beta-barrel protein [Vibrio amylolyticus]MCK6265436.1 porin family protein [Vibrio amylolyticus]
MKKLAIILGLALASTSVVAEEAAITEETQSREFYAMVGAGYNTDNSTNALLTIGGHVYGNWSLESTMMFYTNDYKSDDGVGNTMKNDADTLIFTITPLYTYALTETFDVYGKAGLQHRRSRIETTFSSKDKKDQMSTGTDSDLGYTYGFGVQYTMPQPIIADSRLRIRGGIDWNRDFNGNDGWATSDKATYGLQAGLTF